MHGCWTGRKWKGKNVKMLKDQSTFCHVLQESGENHKRAYKVCNLDPAAEIFKYKCDIGKYINH